MTAAWEMLPGPFAGIIEDLKRRDHGRGVAAAGEAAYALKRYLVSVGRTVYGLKQEFIGPPGDTPNPHQAFLLLAALRDWLPRGEFPTFADYIHAFNTVDARRVGQAVSGLIVNTPPAKEEWFEAAGRLDAQLTAVTTWTDETAWLSSEDRDILDALDRRSSLLQTQVEIETRSLVSRRTISDRLPRLLQLDLVRQPDGPRGGYHITPRGQEALRRSDPSPPAH
jgi:hypothetical protein